MLNAIYGAVAMWVLLGALFFWYDETANSSIYNFLDRVITLPWLIIYGVFVMVMFPLVCIWKFFRNAIKGVSLEAWNKYKTSISRWAISTFVLTPKLVPSATSYSLCVWSSLTTTSRTTPNYEPRISRALPLVSLTSRSKASPTLSMSGGHFWPVAHVRAHRFFGIITNSNNFLGKSFM